MQTPIRGLPRIGAERALQFALERHWLGTSRPDAAHAPFTLAAEHGRDPEIKSWLAFSTEKLSELSLLKGALDNSGPADALDASRAAIAS